MSQYRSELSEKEILVSHVYNVYKLHHPQADNINHDVCDVLVNSYFNHSDLHQTIKLLFTHLCDEVDDPEFFDLDYAHDCDDIVFLLYDYAFKFEADEQKLAVIFGKFLSLNDDRLFDSHDEMITEFVDLLVMCNRVQDEDDENVWLRFGVIGLIRDEIDVNKKG